MPESVSAERATILLARGKLTHPGEAWRRIAAPPVPVSAGSDADRRRCVEDAVWLLADEQQTLPRV